jgi:hypothetical protein
MALPLSESLRNWLINSLPKSPGFHSAGHHLQAAGKKSIGYEIVTACTPSFGPKFIVLTRLTT